MAPSLSPDPDARLDGEAAATLIEVARRSIRSGLSGHGPVEPDLGTLPPALVQPRGAFVTLHVEGELNGCIGTVEAKRPLAEVVAANAWAAAFGDPRLPALRVEQLGGTEIEVSVLSALEPMAARDMRALLDSLRPGVDGLMIRDGHRSGVFLPQVWGQLPDPADFVARLQAKAGMSVGSWPPGTVCHRFTVTHLSETWESLPSSTG